MPDPGSPPPLAAREAALDVLGRAPFDVLVVGGGITGAGVARDAAMRGLRTALVEQDDLASGTSSRSSRLVHGGIRYLEHGQLGLVFESSRERRTLRRIAPHLVRPLPFVWPVYAGARIPTWKLSAALTAYDALSLFRNVARHERLGVRDVLAREPHVRREDLVGGARYWDAATDDARLTLATAQAAVDAGAVVVTHARVGALAVSEGRVTGARVTDRLGGRAVGVEARVIVNATGPWSDTLERMADGQARPNLRGSKGVHVSVARKRIGNESALTLLAPQDGRVMFVLPAGDFAIVGTTDTYEMASPDQVRASWTDVDYLLGAANFFFPEARLTRNDVITAWAGLRPLVASERTDADPGAASREHVVRETMHGLVSVTGGKLTTYRVMARDAVDAVERSLGRTPRRARTAGIPLPGAVADVVREVGAATSLTHNAAVAERLVHAHGAAWRDVWALAAGADDLASRIDETRPYLVAELLYAVTHELALTLGDLLVRRVPIAFETRDHGRAAARRVAPLVARWLGWSAEQTAARIAEYDAEVARIFTIED